MGSNGKRGIPTKHAGTQFRSRLEARWACFFDLLGWRWEYEPFDLDGYVPDFLLLGKASVIVEVKPLATGDETIKLAQTMGALKYDYLVVGVSPVLVGGEYNQETLGGLSHFAWGGTAENDWWDTQLAHWCYCETCDSFGFYDDIGGWQAHPCGHWGKESIRSWLGSEPVERRVEERWAEARNATQWMSAR
jgi:hypothetical protein